MVSPEDRGADSTGADARATERDHRRNGERHVRRAGPRNRRVEDNLGLSPIFGGYVTPQRGGWHAVEPTLIDALVRHNGYRLREDGVEARAYQTRGFIVLPPRTKNRWLSTEWRAATLAHECVHMRAAVPLRATCLEDEMAREERVAEIGAILVFERLGWVYPDTGFVYLHHVGGWRQEDEEEALQRVEALFEGFDLAP